MSPTRVHATSRYSSGAHTPTLHSSPNRSTKCWTTHDVCLDLHGDSGSPSFGHRTVATVSSDLTNCSQRRCPSSCHLRSVSLRT
jgi:hypothetical protein